MNIDKTSLILIVSLLSLVYMIYLNVAKQLTVKSYVTTNYMYVFAALLIIVFSNHSMESNGYDMSKLYEKIIPLMILLFITLFGILLTPKENQITKHLFWLGFILLNSILLFPAYKVSKDDNIIWKILTTTGIMFIAMSYIAYSQPPGAFEEWSPYLFMGLCGLLILRALDLLFGNSASASFNTRSWWISIISIILFGGYLIYDTQKIVKDGVALDTACFGKDHLVCADYPARSLSIFLDLTNVLVNMTNIFKNRQ